MGNPLKRVRDDASVRFNALLIAVLHALMCATGNEKRMADGASQPPIPSPYFQGRRRFQPMPHETAISPSFHNPL